MREKEGFPPEMVDIIVMILLAYLFICVFILNIRDLEIFILAGVMIICLELYRFFLRHKINVRPQPLRKDDRKLLRVRGR
jgi:hypothetical protein